MSQSLNKISLIAFKLQLPTMSSTQLKKIIQDIYAYKWSTAGKLGNIFDIERKETAVLKELQGRGYLTMADREDFYKWVKNMNYKKRSY